MLSFFYSWKVLKFLNRGLLVIFMFLVNTHLSISQSWEDALISKKANLDLHWKISRPFVFIDKDGEAQGLEADLMREFTAYVFKRYGVHVQLKWHEGESFSGVFETIENAEGDNQFGVSAFSITDQRKETVKFTESYLPDITVLVSSNGTPIVNDMVSMQNLLNRLTAITIKGTIYEQLLLDMKQESNLDFNIKYISSSENVLETINDTPNSFGFIDLPIYLLWLQRGNPLVRQNFFTIYGQGYGFILPKFSDWDRPFKEFLSDKSMKPIIAEAISKHMGAELYEFIESLYEGDLLGTSLLTKEKEMQLMQLHQATIELQKEANFQKFLIVIIVISVIFLILLGLALVKIRYNNRLLQLKNNQIAAQRKDIQRKNEQLTKRNDKLEMMHKDKDYLMGIMAHDLKSPLSRILGVTSALLSERIFSTEEQRDFLKHIDDSSKRMNELISKILGNTTSDLGKSYILNSGVRICEIIDDIQMRYEPEAHKKDINFQVTRCSESVEMHTDGLLLSLILENLVSNAIKFSPEKSRVDLETVCAKGILTFIVKDQGPGFTEDDKRKAFQPSEKLSARPTNGESSDGFGLYIVKRYVNDLGGTVWLESDEGKGATFYVRFDSKFELFYR